MGLTYFKRYRMERTLKDGLFPVPALPRGYRLIGWDERLLEAHAEAKYESFRFEIDANVFPCLGDRDGCLRLMREISRRDGFCPEATWLIVWSATAREAPVYCGTIQGIADKDGFGAVQNLGITPSHRGCGLGTVLLHEAMVGFRRTGRGRVYLEVTAQNLGAIRLYERLGFRRVKTVYKAADVAYA